MNLGKNICNMIECRRFEHPLFRSFGCGQVVDAKPITRGELTVECAKWFPTVTVKSIDVVKASIDGSFEYNINLEGR